MKKIGHYILAPIFNRNPALQHAYRLYRYIKTNKAFFVEPEKISLGFKFNGNPIMENGKFEIFETTLIKKLLPQADVVINIGANIGYYTCLALSQNKKTIAIEPINANLYYLLRNIKANNWEVNAEVFPLAVSDRVGVFEIYGGGTGASLIKGWSGTPKNEMTLVPATTLDTLFLGRFKNQKILFIVDIEGAEKFMLDGAINFIDMTPKPIWFVEITAHTHQPQGVSVNPFLMETFEKFWEKGYKSWGVTNGKIVPVTKPDIQNIIETDWHDGEMGNYIFTDFLDI